MVEFGLENPPMQFPTLLDFYKMSIVNLENHYDTCLMMSVKTSNNQEVLDRMPFNKFAKLVKSLQKYIEAENKANSGESHKEYTEETMNNMRQTTSGMMSQMKKPSFKMPSMKFK